MRSKQSKQEIESARRHAEGFGFEVIEVTEHAFSLVFQMGDPSLEPYLDALVDAGCDDGTFAGPAPDGTFAADFDREAPSFGKAIASAVQALRATLPGFHLLRVEPDDLVSQAAIAERAGRSVESVRLYIAGQRGPGSFPPALAAINHKTLVWSWAEVARWWEHTLGESVEGAESASFVAGLNAALRAGAAGRGLHTTEDDEQLVCEIVEGELVGG